MPTPDVAKWGDLYKRIVEGLYLTNANVPAVFPWELNIVYNDKCLYLHTFLSLIVFLDISLSYCYL